jgi:hypothetical protein
MTRNRVALTQRQVATVIDATEGLSDSDRGLYLATVLDQLIGKADLGHTALINIVNDGLRRVHDRQQNLTQP